MAKQVGKTSWRGTGDRPHGSSAAGDANGNGDEDRDGDGDGENWLGQAGVKRGAGETDCCQT